MPSGLDRTNSQQQQQKKAKRSTVNSILATAETPPTTGSPNPPPNTAKKQPQLNGSINKATANSNKKNEKSSTKAMPVKIETGKIGVKRKTAEAQPQMTGPENVAKRGRVVPAKMSAVVKSAADTTGSPNKPQQQPKPAEKVVVKTEVKEATKPAAAPPATYNNNNGFNPLDNILNEIDAFDTSNKPKQKKKREKKQIKMEVTTSDIGGEDGNAPCSSQQLPSTPLPSTVRPLNKLELTRQEQDNTMVQVFLHREDLMERILAYKMLRGRVESYLTMKAKIDLNSCIVPEYEIRPDLVDPVSARLHPKLEPFIKEESGTNFETNSAPARHHHSSRHHHNHHRHHDEHGMRGPMTPPGSPGTNHSSKSNSADGGKRHHHHHHHHYLGIDERERPSFSGDGYSSLHTGPLKFETQTSSEEMLRRFGTIMGIPEQRIRSLFGNELQKLGHLKPDDWLETIGESLKNLAEKKMAGSDFGQLTPNPDLCTSNQFINIGQQQQSQNAFTSSNAANVDTMMEAAMDISSESSNDGSSSGSPSPASSSGMLLPPPPAPPPMNAAAAAITSTSAFGTEQQLIAPPLPPFKCEIKMEQEEEQIPPPPPPQIQTPTQFIKVEPSSSDAASMLSNQAVHASAATSSTTPRKGGGGNGPATSDQQQRRFPANSDGLRGRNYAVEDEATRQQRTVDHRRMLNRRRSNEQQHSATEQQNGHRRRGVPNANDMENANRERRMDNAHPRMAPRNQVSEASMTAACAKPVSLLSLEIKAPPQKAEANQQQQQPPKTPSSTSMDVLKQANSTTPNEKEFTMPKRPQPQTQLEFGGSPLMPTNTNVPPPTLSVPPPAITSPQAASKRAPVMVNLEFIKNTPPPPIPAIIKKTLPNRTGSPVAPIMTGPPPMPMPTPQMSMPPPPYHPPQLLNMDLRMPPPLTSSLQPPPVHLPPPNLMASMPPPSRPIPNHPMPMPSPPQQMMRPPPLPDQSTMFNQSTMFKAMRSSRGRRGSSAATAHQSPYGRFF